MVGRHKVVGFQLRIFVGPNGINLDYFQLHISQNVAKSMHGFTSRLCGDSLLAVSKMEPFVDHLSPLGCQQAAERSLSRSTLLNFWL